MDMEKWETGRSLSGGGENVAEEKKKRQKRVTSRGCCPVGRSVEVTRSGYSVAIRRGFLETWLSEDLESKRKKGGLWVKAKQEEGTEAALAHSMEVRRPAWQRCGDRNKLPPQGCL